MPKSALIDYVPRAAHSALRELMDILPVVVITGARQTGKSRFAGVELKSHEFFTLDDITTRTDASRDPATFVRRAPRMVIDEIQRVPELLIAVKAAVDEEYQKTRGRFVLTGSANLLLMRNVSESLAGRAAYLTLEPMTQAELAGKAATGKWELFFDRDFSEWTDALSASHAEARDWRSAVKRGGFPYPALRLEERERPVWFDGYITTYLERDLRELSAIGDLTDFRRAMQAFALRAGNPVNAAAVAAELGLVARTLRRWLDLLHVSYQLIQLPPYTIRKSVRLRRRPKYYWNDAALAMHLSNASEPEGVHFETMIFADIRAWAALQARRPEVMFWRDEENREVDFIIEHSNRLLAIEVKATTRPGVDDWKHLAHFLAEYPKRSMGGLLLHGGTETFVAGKNLLVTPWWRVL